MMVTFHPTLGSEGKRARYVWPEHIARAPIPDAVPPHIAEDYREAVLVLQWSPKASAALSRRCLQNLLRERGFKNDNLSKQIDAAEPKLPEYLRADLHTVREIGNFAAHPQKAEESGLILGVEDCEADWTLEVLEELFEHFYTRPGESQARRDAINKKRVDAGKKPMG